MSTPDFPPLPDSVASSDLTDIANRLNSSTIHFLRYLRQADDLSGLSASRQSLLALLVFGGPRRLTEIANRERISKPSASRMVRMLEDDGLVTRSADPEDSRAVTISATPEGIATVEASRSRRIQILSKQLSRLPAETLDTLSEAADCLEAISRSLEEPQTSS